MDAVYALEAKEVGLRYGRFWALRDCSFALPPRRIAALIGPNGAGKTSLLDLVVGLAQPSAGRLEVFGRQLLGATRESLAAVGFVAQDRPLYRGFRVGEMLRLGRALNRRWDEDLARVRLARFGIAPEARVGALSGGQQAQVALALALAKRPRLLVLDEPLASLDPLARREFLDTLAETAADQGVTVLFSSHVVTELEQVCDFLLVLSGGRLRLSGPLRELLGGRRSPDGIEGLVLSSLRGSEEVPA